jgi:hypothetical protein
MYLIANVIKQIPWQFIAISGWVSVVSFLTLNLHSHGINNCSILTLEKVGLKLQG